MKTIRYLLPIIPVPENSLHKNFYQHFCSVLRCFSYYDSSKEIFTLPNKKTQVKVNFFRDENHLEIFINSRKIFKGKWEKQLIAVLDEFVNESYQIN